jgi:ABC-type xylose transport system substrate-binding protein
MALTVEIPKAQLPALEKLLTLSKEKAAALVKALRVEAPSLELEIMAERLARPLQLPADDLADILMMLSSMYLTRQARSDAEGQFIAAVVSAAKSNERLQTLSIDWDDSLQLLTDLLACSDSLGVTAKAIGVTADHEKTYAKARILTDIRAVFGEEIGEKPAAAVIVHTLRIAYHSLYENGDSAFYIAMDIKDLQNLQAQIHRALAKENALAQTLAASNLILLSPQRDK